MPPLGWILGKVDFSNLYITLPDSNGVINSYSSLDAAKAAGAVTINYGNFINTLISFVIIVCAVFMLIKMINKLQAFTKKEEIDAKPQTKTCPKCCSEININATKCPYCTSDI